MLWAYSGSYTITTAGYPHNDDELSGYCNITCILHVIFTSHVTLPFVPHERHMILILYHTYCHVIYLFLHGRFYPYHYAPFVSDIKDFATLRIEFDLGTPFLPYQQLLSVLPPASKSLLPSAYQDLMLNEDSVLKEFSQKTLPQT